MVTITNGSLTLSVTQGAYKDIFMAQGFSEISDTPDLSVKNGTGDVDSSGGIVSGAESETRSEDVFDEENKDSTKEIENPATRRDELAEIPLNEMTSEELREYAKILGIDIRGLKSRSAVKNKIRSAL